MDQQTIKQLAAHLEDAELNARAIHKITDDYPDLDVETAYLINEEIRHRKESRGIKTVGIKIGLTSKAKMVQMGVGKPGFGYLYDYFACADGGEIEYDRLIHPKVEPEIAFVTSKELKGPGCHIGTVLSSLEFVMPAMEIIDSRFENFRFDLPSVAADNSSSSRFVTGGRHRKVEEVELKTLGVVMETNGDIIATGAGGAVLDHPANAVATLANMLAEKGRTIPAGTFIMTGAITAAQAVHKGDNVSVHYQGLGTISCRFV